MTDIIEQVQKAYTTQEGSGLKTSPLPETIIKKMVLAMLKAIREPTEEQLEAVCPQTSLARAEHVDGHYTAMIDVLIKEMEDGE